MAFLQQMLYKALYLQLFILLNIYFIRNSFLFLLHTHNLNCSEFNPNFNFCFFWLSFYSCCLYKKTNFLWFSSELFFENWKKFFLLRDFNVYVWRLNEHWNQNEHRWSGMSFFICLLTRQHWYFHWEWERKINTLSN